MPTAQQKQSDFVDEAMTLADVYAMNVLLAPCIAQRAELRAHLESHAQQQAAVVGALVEALESVESLFKRYCDRVAAEDTWARDLEHKVSAALALVKEAK